jgi:hypothetical protein
VLHNLVESARRSARGPLVDEEFSVTGRAADPMEYYLAVSIKIRTLSPRIRLKYSMIGMVKDSELHNLRSIRAPA